MDWQSLPIIFIDDLIDKTRQ